MKHLLDDAVNPPEPDHKKIPDPDPETGEKNTEFTEEEREGYYIIRAILSSIVLPSRITYRDTTSYCNILLDNNGRRQIARFYFNNFEKKKLEIFSLNGDGSKGSETFPINNINEIHKYADHFKKIVMFYEQPKVF
jgi:hypothetical protein